MGKRRKRRVAVAKIPPHRGPVLLPAPEPPATLLQLQEIRSRSRDLVLQVTGLPVVLLGRP